MKNFLAILAVVLLASTAASAADPNWYDLFYPNVESRLNTLYSLGVFKDYDHGQPGNPYNVDNSLLGGPLANPMFDNGFVQLDDMDEEKGPSTFMWQTGLAQELPIFEDQIDLIRDGCIWYDYPEYVGCTEYFYLFVYEPLYIDCVCLDYKCIGIFAPGSKHVLFTENQDPFKGNGEYSCFWTISGQPGWFVVLSGEVLYITNGGVDITWWWYLSSSTLSGLSSNFFGAGDNFTTLINLNSTGDYYAGVAAHDVAVAPNATRGVHTWEATVSGFYYL